MPHPASAGLFGAFLAAVLCSTSATTQSEAPLDGCSLPHLSFEVVMHGVSHWRSAGTCLETTFAFAKYGPESDMVILSWGGAEVVSLCLTTQARPLLQQPTCISQRWFRGSGNHLDLQWTDFFLLPTPFFRWTFGQNGALWGLQGLVGSQRKPSMVRSRGKNTEG